MKKLVTGILDFRKNVLPTRREVFAKLALGQNPDALFITCSDSRIAPNWFASTDPGDLFVVRNVGNLVPSYPGKNPGTDYSVSAAIDFATQQLKVRDIIICGHSGCGAMHALLHPESISSANLTNWLLHAQPSLYSASVSALKSQALSEEDRLSQRNVLQQIKHLKTYPGILESIKASTLRLHAWWFHIGKGDVQMFDDQANRFVPIDERSAAAITY